VLGGCKADGNRWSASVDEPDSLAQISEGQNFEAQNVQVPLESESSVATTAHTQQSEVVTDRSHTTAIRTLSPGENLNEIVDATSGVVLVDFYADWCGPCKKQSKVLHDVDEYARGVNAQIIKVNVDKHRELASQFQVASLPTLMVVKGGEISEKKTGFTQRKQVEKMLR
tara:strand:+ start:54505 stop:55014 length:510 start_codon:yes stop_codon:yes gene_type:complete